MCFACIRFLDLPSLEILLTDLGLEFTSRLKTTLEARAMDLTYMSSVYAISERLTVEAGPVTFNPSEAYVLAGKLVHLKSELALATSDTPGAVHRPWGIRKWYVRVCLGTGGGRGGVDCWGKRRAGFVMRSEGGIFGY